MDGQRICTELKARGYNFTRIARVLAVSPNHVSAVARRIRLNHRVAIAIATALEVPVDLVFPDVPMYHGPVMTDEEREAALARKLEQINGIRRYA